MSNFVSTFSITSGKKALRKILKPCNFVNLNLSFYLNFASVEFAAYARRRVCNCSVLLQMPCNAADAVKSMLPEGRQS